MVRTCPPFSRRRATGELETGCAMPSMRTASSSQICWSVRLALVAAWRESAVFTEAERAVLALAEEGTRLADAHQGVSDETWAQVRTHFDDDQVAALVCLVALINAANRLGVIVHQRGGSYEPGAFARAVG